MLFIVPAAIAGLSLTETVGVGLGGLVTGGLVFGMGRIPERSGSRKSAKKRAEKQKLQRRAKRARVRARA